MCLYMHAYINTVHIYSGWIKLHQQNLSTIYTTNNLRKNVIFVHSTIKL